MEENQSILRFKDLEEINHLIKHYMLILPRANCQGKQVVKQQIRKLRRYLKRRKKQGRFLEDLEIKNDATA